MELLCITLVALVVVWAVTYFLYLGLSRGLSASARHQQASRYLICALFAVVPVAVCGGMSGALWGAAALSLGWMLTWPVLDLLTRRGHATEIDNKMDFAFALHLFGAIAALWGLCGWLGLPHFVTDMIISAVELPVLFIILMQWIYYGVYGACVDHEGLDLGLNTDASEVKEFFKSFPPVAVVGVTVGLFGALAGWCVWTALSAPAPSLGLVQGIDEAVILVAILAVMLRGRSSSLRRTGIATLWRDNMEYRAQNKEYVRSGALRLSRLGDLSGRRGSGRTFVLVIGESASREYMSAFTPQPDGIDDTPWLSGLKSDPYTVLFEKAYSCHFQTVPTLTHALTAANQTNELTFREAPSVVDLAHVLGMEVRWYSNQSRVGFNDTPISLMAESADDFAWTRLGTDGIAYDGALLDFLPRIHPDPLRDTLLVFHLKGSHFNYESRYPAEAAILKAEVGKKGYEAHYRNSLAYTDDVLQKLYDYCKENLKLAAMIYCSDHADIPTSRRSPVFNGMARLRIPMVVSLADDYARENPGLKEALQQAGAGLWVNDFLYDIVAAVLAPDRFTVPAPLAHPKSLLGTLPLDDEKEAAGR